MSLSLSDRARLFGALRGLISASPSVRAAAEREWLAVPLVERERIRAALLRAKRPRLSLAEAQERAAKLRAAAGRN